MPPRPLLTLSMIVKDEAATIGRTLASVKPHVDRWVIADTGSSDDTADVVREAMAGVPGEVVELPFVDFATTRNAALDRCGTQTPFILWLDAEDVLEGGAALREHLRRVEAASGPEHEAYYLRVASGGHTFDSARLLRAASGWRFRGAVHEVLVGEDRPPPVIRVQGVTIRHEREASSAERSAKRWERDVGLLEAALARDPSDARATFYLGQTLSWLGRRDEARRVLERRVALGGWVEEIYQAKITIADMALADGGLDAALPLYLDAHLAAPHRAEPLHAIAFQYNLAQKHALTLLFARRAYELPFPAEDRLFVDESVYRFRAADLVASSAYWVGAFELGEEAARKAVRACPGDERLARNLQFYMDRKKRPKR